ncbi:ras-related protein Rap-1b-like [Centruroides sculpturatus]|uniref:ras-related protein Rap-1b-like n=1 Tax=Centruroides sculpturatus TaxID=218467 RepID=UPI000C6CD8CB|nr:ras-related protein Rap-1b-like [Centruroides sculpturatus]
MRETKVVVLGAGGVGKTSLVVQFLEGFFSYTYKPTVEDCYRHTIQMPDGVFHTMEILDTAGSHHFPAMRELSIRSGRGFVIVFSVDGLQSFHEAVQLYELVSKIRGTQVPVILVGNKSDLVEERTVTQEMVQQITEMFQNCRYIETSAKYNINVNELFVQLLQQIQELEQPPAPDSSRRPSKQLSRRLSSLAVAIRRKSSNTKLPLPTTPENTPDSTRCLIL